MLMRTVASFYGVGLLAGALLLSSPVYAQRGGFDPTDFLKRLDTNGNGSLEPDEVSGRASGFVRSAAERAGLDPSKPLPIDKIAESMQRAAEERSRGESSDRDSDRDRDDRDRDRDRSDRRSSTPPPPLVPGFGEEVVLNPPPGFNVPLSTSSNRYQRPLEERFEKAVIDRVDEMLRQYDRDKSQSIEYTTREGRDVTWQYPPERSDRNNDGRLDREELCYRIADILGSRERRETSGSSSSSSSRSSGSSGSGESDRYRRYAEGLLRQNDENRSGQLERDEWSKMRGDYEKADSNRDGVITLDELTTHLTNYSRDDESSSSSSSRGRSTEGGSRDGYWGREEGKTEAGSSRFLTALERLPKGLPTWFTRNDMNQDGQVSMAEYSTIYNETTAAEFTKYDHNGDGMITAEECLAGPKEPATTATSSTAGATPPPASVRPTGGPPSFGGRGRR